MTLEAATGLFRTAFSSPGLRVTESYHTYHDTLEGHWGWWVRIEGQFVSMAPETRKACDREVRGALSDLSTEEGIPYTIHCLHLTIRPGAKLQH